MLIKVFCVCWASFLQRCVGGGGGATGLLNEGGGLLNEGGGAAGLLNEGGGEQQASCLVALQNVEFPQVYTSLL